MAKINTVIFDIGNVMVRWSPLEIIRLTFGEGADISHYMRQIFQNELWVALNMGQISEEKAKVELAQRFSLEPSVVDSLFYYVKETQILLYHSLNLLERLSKAGFRLYALTDNVNEIVEHLKKRYDFWRFFDGIVVSAEINLMKPDIAIYNYLCKLYNVNPHEAVFMDDTLVNIEGAAACGLNTIHFENAIKAEKELKALGLTF